MDSIIDSYLSEGAVNRINTCLEAELPIGWLRPLLSHYTPKYIKVDYWPIGLLNLSLKITIFVYVVWSLYVEQSWAYSEVPLGTVNAFGVATADYYDAAGRGAGNLPSYCNNPQHAFKFSNEFNYTTPDCRFTVPEQLVIKGKGQVQVVTAYLERKYSGFPCGLEDKRQDCTSTGGQLTVMESGQCLCLHTDTVYPLGVEKMGITFEHTYQFPVGKYGLKEWKGSSTLTAAEAAGHPEITSTLESQVAVCMHQCTSWAWVMACAWARSIIV